MIRIATCFRTPVIRLGVDGHWRRVSFFSRKQSVLWFAVFCSWLAVANAPATELADAEQLFHSGQYRECIAACSEAIEEGLWPVDWRILKMRAELTTGQHSQALETFETALATYPTSIPLRLCGYDSLRLNDRAPAAEEQLRSIQELTQRESWRYGDSVNRVAIGRALYLAGADARRVLESFYDPAKKMNTVIADPYIATGELALEKHDFALAAEAFAEAARRAPDDPDVQFGLARALGDDADKAASALAKALAINRRHIPSLLLQAERAIDAEEFIEAETLLAMVLDLNPQHPRAWAYRAVIAYLNGQPEHAAHCRTQALRPWPKNPEVDFAIGQKLSRAYRFEEGASHQRAALEFDPRYRPARLQLSQDLLRLGHENEGWTLAAESFDDDQYNVVAFNLTTLRDNLAKFYTIENQDFILRMDSRESQLYGRRAMRLLQRAKSVLCEKYQVQLPRAIVVEMFPRQSDFAIRTFGLPGGAGYLGVCFGGVITANSPAAQGESPANWEAVLWHEFCHVVTLSKTKNRIPRWLSEGISVYEERQANAAWGQSMTPHHRQTILTGGFRPISQLSGAFMKASSAADLRFAYFESSLAVEYLVGRFGSRSLFGILDDLRDGLAINAALARRTEPLDELDLHFAAWLRRQAADFAPPVDWRRPEISADAEPNAFAEWNETHPNAYWGLVAEGRAWAGTRDWARARKPLAAAVALLPKYADTDSAYPLLAKVDRELHDTVAERSTLEALASLAADAAPQRLRLAELASERGDWRSVAEHSAAALAVNPLAPAAHRLLARATEQLGDDAMATESLQSLLTFDPIDIADIHYRLAIQYWREGMKPESEPAIRGMAKRHLLMALENSPRFVAAHRLLLEIVRAERQPPTPTQVDIAPDAPPLSRKGDSQ